METENAYLFIKNVVFELFLVFKENAKFENQSGSGKTLLACGSYVGNLKAAKLSLPLRDGY
ncbi:hypothetical protein D910_01387 [Dendroctonus ponderosae]|uniref:Uncharacterized protein n=1 Tax=Dendroctonus ponderosae TaxID=77166 RepID=U4TRG3_DENPD|nr:hypothetical protein D910_01387 [Dendroctonus ponderosae]